MKVLLFYALNVIIIAVPLAIFEIWLEQFKSGWDGEFIDPFWGRKIREPWLCKIFEKAYVTPYHLVMFGGIIPGITILEYLFLHYLAGYGWFLMSVYGIVIVPPVFIGAVWIGNMVLEDFLWFAFNTWFECRFPDALSKLFRGEFKWHTKWVRVTPSHVLPRFYLTTPIWIAALLLLQDIIVRLSL